MRTFNRLAAILLLVWASFSPPAMGQAAPPVAGDYTINSGDELLINVWGEERLSRPVRVLPDGSISLPLVGKINAEGISTNQLEGKIADGLRDQYRGQVPAVTVSVANPAGLQFTVMGRVKAPGTFTPGRYVNVLEALSLAGGPTEFADLNNILIIRKVGDGIQTIHLDVGKLFKGGRNLGNVDLKGLARVQTGDTIIVR